MGQIGNPTSSEDNYGSGRRLTPADNVCELVVTESAHMAQKPMRKTLMAELLSHQTLSHWFLCHHTAQETVAAPWSYLQLLPSTTSMSQPWVIEVANISEGRYWRRASPASRFANIGALAGTWRPRLTMRQNQEQVALRSYLVIDLCLIQSA